MGYMADSADSVNPSVTLNHKHSNTDIDFVQRDRWIRLVCADEKLTAAQRLVLIRIAHYLRVDTGECAPKTRCLQHALAGMSSSTVIAAIAAGERRGWLSISHGGKRNGRFEGSDYELKFPPGAPASKSEAAPASKSEAAPASKSEAAPASKSEAKSLNEDSYQALRADEQNKADAVNNNGHCVWTERGVSSPDGKLTVTTRQIAEFQRQFPGLPNIAGHIQAALHTFEGKSSEYMRRWLPTRLADQETRAIQNERHKTNGGGRGRMRQAVCP